MPIISAPMTGTVKEILVAPGEAVVHGQEVVVLESMKMEIPVEAEAAGRVAEVLVEPAQAVDEGQALLRLE